MESGPSDAFVEVVKRRLFICCDGTWQDGVNNKGQPLTNVARLARSIKGVSDDGYLQLVYYDSGVGNGTGLFGLGQGVDGATGRGISAKIRNAYSFVSYNYQDGDEIILVGFSRGAFTVQCVASLIGQIGLLRKEDLQYLRPLFTLWANQDLRTWSNMTPLQVLLKEITDALKAPGKIEAPTTRKVKIKALAVWDTVSALGFPTPTLSPRPLSFVGKSAPRVLEHAFQALALNESRRLFKPVVWREGNEGCRNVTQCWFLGSHADVGGGSGDPELATISLIWMASKLIALGVTFETGSLIEFLGGRHMKWIIMVNRPLGRYKATLKLPSHARRQGFVTKTAWYWWFAGLKRRRKYFKASADGGEDRRTGTADGSNATADTPSKSRSGETFGRRRRSDATSTSPSTSHSEGTSRASEVHTDSPGHESASDSKGKGKDLLAGGAETDDSQQRAAELSEQPFAMNIHFSVRLMMAKKKNKCNVLEKWKNVPEHGRIMWEHPNMAQKKIPEDESGPGEWKLLRGHGKDRQAMVAKTVLSPFLYHVLELAGGEPARVRVLYNNVESRDQGSDSTNITSADIG